MKKPGMKRKPRQLSVAERVNLLMEYGTDHPEKWMPVHGYVEPNIDNSVVSWLEEWYELRTHHLAETKFLFEVIEELRARLQHEYDIQDVYSDE